ncbi:DNA polymerase III subunit delta' [Crenothrix sp. D3]|nr:DNA polymerase III subunit delta' [Crenothrix sp. D3]
MTTLPWQHAHWAHLHSYIVQQRIPQALLITGGKGVGKLQLAEQFAAALLCEQPQTDSHACGQCHSCLLLKAQTHPDFMQVQPEEGKTTIAIDQIRSLITKLTLKPQFDRYRVVILNPADKMNNAAANAFLKCLEEPNERTILVLVSDRQSKLPATILSRCQKLAIAMPDKATVLTWLTAQAIKDDASVLLGLAQGAPLLALSYAKEGVVTQRNDCFKQFLAVAKRQNHPVIVAEQWLKLPEAPLLFWLTSWVVDLIKCAYQSHAEHLYNPDLHTSLRGLTQSLELKKLYQLYDLLLLSRQRLESTLNKQSLFEEILIQWSELNRSR